MYSIQYSWENNDRSFYLKSVAPMSQGNCNCGVIYDEVKNTQCTE